jgi:P27 family predicted phage terminase small subunit
VKKPTGAKPTPTALRIVTGAKATKPNDAEAMPAIGAMPTAPAHLGADAKREWKRAALLLYNLGLLTNVDRAAMAAYCVAYGRWCEAERVLKAAKRADPASAGLLATTSNGNVIQNPIVGVANSAMRDMVAMAAEFGMTPSARTRIRAHPRPSAEGQTDSRPQKPEEDEFFGNRRA